MDRKLPYELDYKTLKKLRSYETVLLYANIIIPLIFILCNLTPVPSGWTVY